MLLDPRLAVLLAATVWGTTGTARALGPDDASPTAVGAARLVVGGACLVLVGWRQGWLSAPRTDSVRRPWRRGGATPVFLVSVGAMAAYQPLFFGGVDRTGVAVGTMVGIGSSPVFAGLLGIVVRSERPGRRWLAATALAVAGTLLLVGAGDRDDVDPTGLALALGAGLAYAIYVLATKLLLDGGSAPDALTARVFGCAGLVLLPAALAAGIGPLLSPGGLLMVAHLGIVTVAVGYVLFTRGLTGVGVAAAGTLTLAEPATATLFGIAVLGERPGGAALAGLALVAAGIVLLVTNHRRGRVAVGSPVRRVVACSTMRSSNWPPEGTSRPSPPCSPTARP
jgi:drug/metabolite transporter, DME family